MKNGTCPKCGSNEIISELNIRGGESHPPYVQVVEPAPANRPFVWMPKSEQGHFRAWVCGACGYTEIYTDNYQGMNEGRKKGFQSS